MIMVETLPQIFGGYLQTDPGIAQSLGIDTAVLTLIVFLQVAIGGVLILYMDEIVSKWGIGSGVSLFIVAGIAQALVGGIINWIPSVRRTSARLQRADQRHPAREPADRNYLQMGLLVYELRRQATGCRWMTSSPSCTRASCWR